MSLSDFSDDDLVNVFTYWGSVDRSPVAEFAAEWGNAFSSFQIFGDQDVIPLIESHSHRHVDLYRSIRFPAAKSDVARLFLLYEFGGLYVDCHFGIRDYQGILDQFNRLTSDLELIVVDRARFIAPRPLEEYYFINGAIFARPRCAVVLMCAFQALANLECHRSFERLLGSLTYHVATLSGPGVLNSIILDQRYIARSLRTTIRHDYERKIGVIKEEIAPFVRNRHSSYRKSGQHWSERQISEKLFNDK